MKSKIYAGKKKIIILVIKQKTAIRRNTGPQSQFGLFFPAATLITGNQITKRIINADGKKNDIDKLRLAPALKKQTGKQQEPISVFTAQQIINS